MAGPQQRNVDTTHRRLKARQRNVTQDSIDALHRRTLHEGPGRCRTTVPAGRPALGPWRTSTQVAMSSLAKKVAVPMATDEGLDCLVWNVTKNVWQWCLCATSRWFLPVLSACVSTRLTRLPVCQRLGQEYIEKRIQVDEQSKRQWCSNVKAVSRCPSGKRYSVMRQTES